MAYEFKVQPGSVGYYTLMVKTGEATDDYPAQWNVIDTNLTSLEHAKQYAQRYVDNRRARDEWTRQTPMRFTID